VFLCHKASFNLSILILGYSTVSSKLISFIIFQSKNTSEESQPSNLLISNQDFPTISSHIAIARATIPFQLSVSFLSFRKILGFDPLIVLWF
jgi:hypothetical protein